MWLVLCCIFISGCSTTDPQPTQPVLGEDVLSRATLEVTRNNDWEPYTDIVNGVEMALVPVGCFKMGSDEAHNTGGELPIHTVCFDQPIWLDVYEVTQAQFAEFGGQAAQESCFQGDDLPRECITWHEAQAFCELRSARLPYEAEWEYAARGPESWKLPWGEDQALTKVNAVYAGNTFDGTKPVGSKPGGMSWVGAHDLSGNVWEWNYDWYGEFYFFTLEPGEISPHGPEEGTERVLRGGSWITPGVARRVAIRYRANPDNANNVYGFRCARDFEG